MAEKSKNRLVFYGVILMGLAFIIGGLFLVYKGQATRSMLVMDLRNENLNVGDPTILVTYPDGRAPEGVEVPTVTIDTAQLADAQARLIRMHTLTTTGGLTYSQMTRDDPNRAFYVTSLTLQDSLHLAHLGLEISLLVIGIGVAFTGLGVGILVLGLPIARKVLAL